MANISKPGFRPAKMMGGGDVPVYRFPVDVSNSTNVFVGDVVANNSAGSVRPAAADAGNTACGVVTALYDSGKIPVGSWSSSVSTKYLPASTAGYADVALALQDAVFIATCSTSQAASAIMGSLDHVATAGNTTKATSGHVLNGTSVNTEAQCRIIGKVEVDGNDWGSADAQLYVTFLESMWGQVNPTTGV